MIDRTGTELIIGSSVDSQFGPVLLFGLGGQLVEVFRDRALGLPPLTTTLARRMMERTRVFQVLKGVRGQPGVDLPALERLMVGFSRLVIEQPHISDVEINPLLATPNRLIALDARVILHPAEVPDQKLPRPAIRPYPLQYVGTWQARDGESFLIRPIRPEDETLMVAFHRGLSTDTIYQRYFSHLGYDQRVAHERLVRVCFGDYDRELALVAVRDNEATGSSEIVAVGRLSRLHLEPAAEFAILVSDRFQGRGLGTELLARLIEIGRAEGLERIVADILTGNGAMIAVARKAGFRFGEEGEGTLRVEMRLDRQPSAVN
jgi:acetyltransferase